MPVLLKPPAVGTSADGRYLVIQWHEWLANITGSGTGPVVGYTLQGLTQLDDGNWQNLVTMEQQALGTSARPAAAARWFTYVAEGCVSF